jgi:hypothetical protein
MIARGRCSTAARGHAHTAATMEPPIANIGVPIVMRSDRSAKEALRSSEKNVALSATCIEGAASVSLFP